MALYAFDGTGNSDDGPEEDDTNVVRFREVYAGADYEYLTGVGTRLGAIGKVAGGLFGLGGRSRIEEMYDTLCENVTRGDEVIDVVGFSRGAALAVHFANKIAKQGIEGSDRAPKIRFLGLWDLVASFGLSFNNVLDFQKMNILWDVEKIPDCVEACYHAMALDERREAFGVTRLDPDNKLPNVQEVWFRGVHSDVGGGNGNIARSNIALQWLIEKAIECGVEINQARAKEPRYTFNSDANPPVSENKDLQRDPRRETHAGDEFHHSVAAKLVVGQSRQCRVFSARQYNWSGVTVEPGARYEVSVADGQTWDDGEMKCDANGWATEELSWVKEKFVEFFESRRRAPDQNWFKLIAALGDEDDQLVPIGGHNTISPGTEADLYLFANDLRSSYGNNEGFLDVVIRRTT